MSLYHYKYKARNPFGKQVNGIIEAATPGSAAATLIERGLIPIAVQQKPPGITLDFDLQGLFKKRVPPDDLIQFTRQMHSMTKASIPVLRALTHLSQSTPNSSLAQTLVAVIADIESGQDLAKAFGNYPEVFSLFYVSMIRVGETTGRLDNAFFHLIEALEKDKNTRAQTRSALRYPTFILIAISAAVVIINLYVIPGFEGFFRNFKAELPLPTQIAMAISHFSQQYWLWILGAAVAAFFGVRYYISTRDGRLRWDRLKLRLPIVGTILHQAVMARFSRLSAVTMKAGVPLLSAIAVIAEAVDNAYVGEQILAMRANLNRGESLGRAAAAVGVFDPLVLQMLAVGEEANNISEMLQEVADYYDREVAYKIERLSGSIEPIMTMAMGGIVLLLALAVFLPMWKMGSVALHH
jgi:MSHA biogenesis protein MshG